jgi:hypothetical protein
MSYEQNKPSLCYYVNLATYTNGYFGNTNFNPPLSDPVPKTIVSYTMNNYNSLTLPVEKCSQDVRIYQTYAKMASAYNKPDCTICSPSDCQQ